MKLYSLLLFAMIIASASFCQEASDTASKKGKIYSIHISKMDGSVQKGYLYSVNENELTITPVAKNVANLYTISAEQLNTMQIRRKGNVAKGVLIGAGTGAVAGILIGLISGDDPPNSCDLCPYESSLTAGEKAAIGGITGLFAGAGTGMIIGALTKKKFTIHGKRENYVIHYQELVERAMTQQ
jgi:hypothetical protein